MLSILINAFIDGKIIQREPRRPRANTSQKIPDNDAEIMQRFANALSTATSIKEVRAAATILLEETQEEED